MNLGPTKQLDLHDSQRTEPKYERLKNHLLSELKEGRLKPGEALPTELELAGALQVARSTVRQALGELDREGLIQRIRGKGTFVSQDVQRRLSSCLNAFALVVPETQGGHYPALLHGFEDASTEAHNQVLISSTDNDIVKQGNVILQLLEKEVAGVAIVPTTTPAPAYQILPLQRQGIPVVFCHRRMESVQAPLLAIPYRRIGRLAGETLVAHGHRRAAIFVPRRDDASQMYVEGFREALRDARGDVPEDFTYYGSGTSADMSLQEEAIAAALRRMLSRPDRPTGMMATFDSMAEVIYLLLGRMKIEVPGELSLISFGGKNRQGAIVRRLCAVVIDGAEIGRRAGELLRQMRTGLRPMDDGEVISIPIELSPGETLGDVPR